MRRRCVAGGSWRATLIGVLPLLAVLGGAAGCDGGWRRALDVRGLVTDIAGANEDNEAWRRATRENTSVAYVLYLRSFPDGIHADEARAALSEAAWREAVAAGTEEAFLTFARRFPKSAHAAEASDRAGAAAYAAAMASRDVARLRGVLGRYPARPEASGAIRLVAEIELQAALSGPDPLATVQFLLSYPRHPRTRDVEARLAELERIVAATAGRPIVLSLWLRRFPAHPAAPELRAKLQAVPPSPPPPPPDAAAASAAMRNRWVSAARCLVAIQRAIRYAPPNSDPGELERWREDIAVVLGNPSTAAQCSRELVPEPADPFARHVLETLGVLGIELDQLSSLVVAARENADVLRNIIALGRDRMESLERGEVVGDALGEGGGGRLSELARQAVMQASAGAASADTLVGELEAMERGLSGIVVTLMRYALWLLDTRQ